MQLALEEIKGISNALAGIKVTVEQTAAACVKIQDMTTRIQDTCTKNLTCSDSLLKLATETRDLMVARNDPAAVKQQDRHMQQLMYNACSSVLTDMMANSNKSSRMRALEDASRVHTQQDVPGCDGAPVRRSPRKVLFQTLLRKHDLQDDAAILDFAGIRRVRDLSYLTEEVLATLKLSSVSVVKLRKLVSSEKAVSSIFVACVTRPSHFPPSHVTHSGFVLTPKKSQADETAYGTSGSEGGPAQPKVTVLKFQDGN
jgi:hypothetical protein